MQEVEDALISNNYVKDYKFGEANSSVDDSKSSRSKKSGRSTRSKRSDTSDTPESRRNNILH